jgi:hypothetical protein
VQNWQKVKVGHFFSTGCTRLVPVSIHLVRGHDENTETRIEELIVLLSLSAFFHLAQVHGVTSSRAGPYSVHFQSFRESTSLAHDIMNTGQGGDRSLCSPFLFERLTSTTCKLQNAN